MLPWEELVVTIYNLEIKEGQVLIYDNFWGKNPGENLRECYKLCF